MCSPAKIQKTQKVAQAADRRPPRRCFLKLPYASLRRERKTASRLRDPPATRRGNTKPSTILTSVRATYSVLQKPFFPTRSLSYRGQHKYLSRAVSRPVWSRSQLRSGCHTQFLRRQREELKGGICSHLSMARGGMNASLTSGRKR